MSPYSSAAAAAQRLGVSRATLYAYVSRGWIRSHAVPGRRSREYSREDIERLAAQARGRRDPLGVARHALEFDGLPVLGSSLSLIDAGHLYYRGRDAVELSRTARFEDVAALLWDGECRLPEPGAPPPATVRRALARKDFAAAAVAHLVGLSPADGSLEPSAVRGVGARLLVELVALASSFERSDGPLAARLARAFGARGPRARRAIDAALILCADHELNASAFAARVVASAGASPVMALAAALAALSGQRHGGATLAVRRLLDERGEPSDVIARVLRSGQVLPGFGHPLYPSGDPRGVRLLELCRKGSALRRAEAFADAARRSLGLFPNVDFGLVALARSYALPQAAPFILFAVGRCAGWVGHVLEQYATGQLIRPRARYVGVQPSAGR
jgi:citrate synthase